ncbi:MAG: ATP-binding protein [Clostridia bacterium]|nr:ATP-binding protein [Clostridia bacterium]
MTKKHPNYPFSAIVGQEDMKRALILNVIHPGIGGVLIRGEKGTAKSTAVRALADVMPTRLEIAGCRFSCDPDDPAHFCEECRARTEIETREGRMRVVNLPVSATEDRVVGTVDIEYALKHGEKRFEAGILADANRNILYVDEVNLLDDHVVDLLLDAAAMGVNSIEREGISYAHPARFVLVGTMNPEEGDLRPQLLDRFGLVVDVTGEDAPLERMEIVRRRLAFESDPEAFAARFDAEQKALGEQIVEAQARLPRVTFSDECLLAVAEVSIALGVDGHRADIMVLKTAIANAAYRGADRVATEDLLVAARLALPHRMRRRPFEEGVMDFEEIRTLIEAHAV